jgi:hypothetical protein
MKLFLGAALSAFLFAAPAIAQDETAAATSPVPASSCGALPEQPALPDGANADREQMEEGNTTYRAWYDQYNANIQCRHAEALALRAQADARFTEHNAAVEALNAANAAWQAEAEEFNGRFEGRRLR